MNTEHQKQFVLGLDVGGTDMKGAVLDQHGRAAVKVTRPVRRERGPDGVIEDILGFTAELIEQARDAQPGAEVVAACLAVPGLVDEEAGIARLSANLGWHNVPLGDLARERLGLSPVVVGHDVRVASIAEGLVGAARGSRNFLFITIGTGIGAAIVLDSQPYVGIHGVAGEIGHIVIDPDGPECGCGRRGCLEALASASAVARHYQRLAEMPQTLATRDVAERARAGDAQARRVWDDAVIALSIGLANYITLIDPERIVIGGGLAEAGDMLFEPLATSLEREVRFQEVPRVLPAALGNRAGYLGAGLKAWMAMHVPKEQLMDWTAAV